MIVKDYDYIKGNIATKPQRKSTELDREKYKELERSKWERKKRKHENERKKRVAALQIAGAVLALGFITIFRDNKVYSMQQEVTKINKSIKQVTEENEALNVELLKIGSLQNIKTNAEEKLGMVMATKDNMLQIDLSQNYFQELENEAQEENKKGESFFQD